MNEDRKKREEEEKEKRWAQWFHKSIEKQIEKQLEEELKDWSNPAPIKEIVLRYKSKYEDNDEFINTMIYDI